MSERGCTSPRIGDLLAAYEMGLLEAADRAAFEEHLADCPACLEELYDGAVSAEQLRAEPGRYAAILREAARAAEPSLGQRLGDAMRRLLAPRVLAPVASVAAVALALMIFLPADGPFSSHLAVVDPLPYRQLEMRGGPGGEIEQLVTEGMDYYAAGEYGAAAARLGPAWERAGADESWSDRHQAALFLGLSLLLDGRPDEAVRPLELAREATLLPIAERAAWYLAQTHLLREMPRESLPLLESLSSSPAYGDRAAAQLLSVREICDN